MTTEGRQQATLMSSAPLLSKVFSGWLMLVAISIALTSLPSSAAVTFEKEIKIANGALFFDGEKVASGTSDRPGYDYYFGNRISPHGDCIKEYKGFVFMTWYRGGEADRHVMLSRYNPNTGVTKTIEFPHRHTGYLNQPHIGESHNTIAVGIAPKDGTIHMLYDMHAYSENKPSSGAFANDYFRYSYSVKDAATVPDDQFTLDLFVNSNSGDYKHLGLRNDVDYRSLTYPNFFTNKEGDLFVWIREGGNNNGAYKFARYDGNSWTKFTQFNILDAKRRGLDYNWGLYGDIKFENGKMRIGFSRRSTLTNDKYELNNGHYYAYTDDPLGASQWKDHAGKGFSLPLIDPETIKISEPGDELGVSGENSVYMNVGSDWTVTENEDVHFVTHVKTADRSRTVKVHTYKKSGDTRFKTATNFPGGNLYTYKNDVYLIGLNAGRVFVDKTPGGENSWTRLYQAPSDSRKYRHGVVHISKGKLYYFLMEQKTGSAQPIYLQVIDLGFDLPPEAPVLADPKDQAPEGFEFAVYSAETLTVTRPVDVAFGRDGEFIYRTNIRSDVLCTTAICSKDPAPGLRKACHIREARTSYGERFIAIPGELQAEHYDYGGNQVSYFDSSPELNKGAEISGFRADEGVDITLGNGGNVIAWTGDGEWVEYTVYVHQAGNYSAGVIASSMNGGEMAISLNGAEPVANLAIKTTGAEDNYQSNTAQLRLPAGEQRLRFTFSKGGFNFDKVIFTGGNQ